MQLERFSRIVSFASTACVIAIIIATFVFLGRTPPYTPWAPVSILALCSLGILLARQRGWASWVAVVVSILALAVVLVWAGTST